MHKLQRDTSSTHNCYPLFNPTRNSRYQDRGGVERENPNFTSFDAGVGTGAGFFICMFLGKRMTELGLKYHELYLLEYSELEYRAVIGFVFETITTRSKHLVELLNVQSRLPFY